MTMPNFTRLAVGELFDPEKTSFMHLNDKANLFLSRTEGCSFIGYFADPKPDEIAAWEGSRGNAKFGWVDAGATAFLVAQLGHGAPYVDASFHPGHLPEELRGLPRSEEQPRMTSLEALTELPDSEYRKSFVVIGATDSEIKGHYAEQGGHLLMPVILINARNGRIAAMRQLTWPPRFVYEVRATVERLMAEPFDPAAEQEAIQRMYRFTPRELYQTMSKVRCVGGEPE